MPRTLMPTPDDAEPGRSSIAHSLLGSVPLDIEDQVLLDFLLGDYVPRAAVVLVLSWPAASSFPSNQTGQDSQSSDDEAMSYLLLASSCFALIQYDPTTPRSVRRVVGMFGDVSSADRYGQAQGYRRYDVVPATAIIAQPSS